MKTPYNYPEIPEYHELIEKLIEYSRLKYEYGTDRAKIANILSDTEEKLRQALGGLQDLPEDDGLRDKEPDNLDAIRILRGSGPRKLWNRFDEIKYLDFLKGSIMGRFAGCILGAPVEFWSIEDMHEWAEYIGDKFPPVDYWSAIKKPNEKRYEVSEKIKYTRNNMKGVPVDDDITYTILGLLIREDYGKDFTVEDVGKAWVKYLPYACTAEEVALENLKKGIAAIKAADKNNPYVQWIGADIRSDPWGYLAPGLPEKAAEFAYRDAYLSHRRNGIYGEMYFSAVIAAAFAVDDVFEALQIGLTEIPGDCLLAGDIRWALEEADGVKNYQQAVDAVQKRFSDMSEVHTNLNACLTIFGLAIGGDDFTKVIGETVAMGYDNDCTAATAGSIYGAVRGIENIPEYWYRNFNNIVRTYINGYPELKIDDVIRRFSTVAAELF